MSYLRSIFGIVWNRTPEDSRAARR